MRSSQSDPQIDHAVGQQFHGRAPRYDLLLVQGKRRHGFQRHPDLAGKRRVVIGPVGLGVMFGFGDNDGVDDRAGDAHAPCVQRPRLGDTLHLAQHDAA